MKNLMIYVGPKKGFTPEHEALTRIQIDNCRSLGWAKKDILLVTNFDYKYNGIKATTVEDYYYYTANKFYRSSKIPVIMRLFELGMIDDLTWFHDHDAFQLEPMRDPELGELDAAFTDHGWSTKFNAGSFFFNEKSAEIFRWIMSRMNASQIDEQDSLTYLRDKNIMDINSRYKMLNITYNLNINYIDQNFKKLEEPLLVAHFHPHKDRHMLLFRHLLNDRFKGVLKRHGFR